MSDTRNSEPITAAAVTQWLADAGVDVSTLTITDDHDVWVDLETGTESTSVKIEGPKPVRQHASGVLMARHGLGCAPYPDRDMWSSR